MADEAEAKNQKSIIGFLALSTLGLLIATIVLATNRGSDDAASTVTEPVLSNVPDNVVPDIQSIFMKDEDNTCADTNPKFANVDCIHVTGPQAGGNVTKGYNGGMEVDVVPNLENYWQTKMCPVNVHWHLGAEHYSVGQYDENGKGPNGNAKLEEHSDDPNTYHDGKNTTKAEATSTNGDVEEAVSTNAEDSAEAGAEEADTDEVDAEEASAPSSAPEETDAAEADADATEDEGASTAETVDEAVSTNATRRLADDYGSKEVRGGFRCHHYDPDDAKFTTEYEWKHCVNMEVGETYEVHWPHSAAGACGTVNQYQTPFYDGVFCNLDLATFQTLTPQNVASAVGVQGQVFTIVNDESYFYPDLIRGWIVDKVDNMGQDIAYYTGSTTGTTRDNQICSVYTPITWQVDRRCHMISASSFDKLCYDMKQQRDDMTDDLHAHGARELVKDSLVANNVQRRLSEHEHGHEHEHDHHDHDHDHSHEHGSDADHDHLTEEQEHHLRMYGHYHEKAVSQKWY